MSHLRLRVAEALVDSLGNAIIRTRPNSSRNGTRYYLFGYSDNPRGVSGLTVRVTVTLANSLIQPSATAEVAKKRFGFEFSLRSPFSSSSPG